MTAPGRSAERRNERRVPCRFTFTVLKASGEGGLASAIDLSPAGMRFETVGCGIAAGDSILVQFTLNARTYSFCGHPLRVNEPVPFAQEVAVRFRSVDSRTRGFLAESIRKGLDFRSRKDTLNGE